MWLYKVRKLKKKHPTDNDNPDKNENNIRSKITLDDINSFRLHINTILANIKCINQLI